MTTPLSICFIIYRWSTLIRLGGQLLRSFNRGATCNMITSSEIEQRLIDNQALFNTLFVVQQQFDIIPNDSNHYGVSIDFQDISELREDFINELIAGLKKLGFNNFPFATSSLK